MGGWWGKSKTLKFFQAGKEKLRGNKEEENFDQLDTESDWITWTKQGVSTPLANAMSDMDGFGVGVMDSDSEVYHYHTNVFFDWPAHTQGPITSLDVKLVLIGDLLFIFKHRILTTMVFQDPHPHGPRKMLLIFIVIFHWTHVKKFLSRYQKKDEWWKETFWEIKDWSTSVGETWEPLLKQN